VVINGQPIGQTTWDGGNRMMQLTFNVPQGVLNSGTNTISLVTTAIGGVDSQIAFVHSIGVDYPRVLDGANGINVVNNSTSSKLYEVFNLPAAGAWVVDTRF